MKLNLGSGTDYKEGWVNLDNNMKLMADIYANINKPFPFFEENNFDYILADNVIEHVDKDNFYSLMQELHRILKVGGIIEIYVPHYKSTCALKYPFHNVYFGIGSFDFMNYQTGMATNYEGLKFKVKEEKLCLFHRHCDQNKVISGLYKFFNWFNFLFNFSRTWKIFCEKFWIFGFEEMKVVLIKQ